MSALRKGPLVPAILFLIFALLYTASLNKAPHFDELYHMLAARGYLTTGQFRIAEGEYVRAWPFTWLVAQLFRLLGEHLWVARLPSLVAVAAMVAILFVWVRHFAGNLSAILVAGLFGVSPFAIDIAQFARFYGLHGLAFLLLALSIYTLVRRPGPAASFILRAALALLALVVAMTFQVTTLIGLAGIGAWAVLWLAGPWFLRADVPTGRKLLVLLGAVLLAALVLALAIASGKLAEALQLYRQTALWSEENANAVLFYHGWILLYYPTLWSLLPVLLIVALVAAPVPVFFSAVLFGTGIVLHSFAAAKDLRYVFYLTPFLFVIWGTALGAILERVLAFTRAHAGVVAARLLPGRRVGRLTAVIMAVAALWLIAANAASIRSATMLADITVPPELPPVQWAKARPVLEGPMHDADIVLVTSELETLYYLGDYDVLVSHSRLGELMGAGEFARDFRTGRPVVSTPESVARIMACYPNGLLVTSIYRWRNKPMLDDAVADLIVAHAQPLELPAGSRVMAYRWSHLATAEPDCPDLRRPSAGAKP